MMHRILAIGIVGLALWMASEICRGQTVTTRMDWVSLSPVVVTSKVPARVRFDQFVDPLVTNTPAAPMLPGGMAAPEALRRRAAAQGRIESLNASPHSNVGIFAGDLRHTDRLIDPKFYPEWQMLRWEALAGRTAPKTRATPSVTVTNAGR
ncbi:MAG: hypothetical protein IT577_22510 [Verrucomicrobiae bacterium]|nr:hypothetical protein [Verrucomicrobiae bacterium]